MPFMDIFRKLFGIRNNQDDHPDFRLEIPRQENDSFRNPIWENEDDDDDYNSDFRQPNGGGMHFQIFGDPFEMTRYFESQMDGILKNFLEGFTGHRGPFMVPFDDDSTIEFALPAPPKSSEKPAKTLRDRILEREFDSSKVDSQEISKGDSDLDGKITAEELSKLWKNPITQEVEPAFKPRNSISKMFSGSMNYSKTTFKGDGSFEKYESFKDSKGNEKTVITRQIGDKVHKVITHRDIEGVETKTENFINMDENEINVFDKKWKTDIQNPPVKLNPDKKNFPWDKFFGPEPKL